MPTYLSRSISGIGQDTLSGTDVLYVQVHIDNPGTGARLVDLAVPDHYLRIGWFSLGDSLPLGAGSVDAWREPIFINTLDVLWTPLPSTSGSQALSVIATRLRWALPGGASGSITVFGL
jgi:hypothetical protein